MGAGPYPGGARGHGQPGGGQGTWIASATARPQPAQNRRPPSNRGSRSGWYGHTHTRSSRCAAPVAWLRPVPRCRVQPSGSRGHLGALQPDGEEVGMLVWQGDEDLMVPAAHGRWLREHVGGAEGGVLAGEGHLTLAVDRIGDVHAWLHERLV
jgi:hypothetical protein